MSTTRTRSAALAVVGLVAGVIVAGVGLLVIAVLAQPSPAPAGPGCESGDSADEPIALAPPGTGELIGATEYGGPGDPGSGTIGASGIDLTTHPDSYAELGGLSFQTATALGGLPYMTPLRVSWGGHSAVAYKRDFGFGGGPIDGLPREIDLWWRFAEALGIPYRQGTWSGPVRIERPPATGAGGVLAQTPAVSASTAGLGETASGQGGSGDGGAGCAGGGPAGVSAGSVVPLTGGARATLLSDGLAAAPASAPAAVRAMIAAGNAIAGKPYLYGAGHGLPLDEIAPAYDCSSSVEHLLYGAGLVTVDYDEPSAALESFGAPGPGRWVTIYASADHVFMYVAGLRWDTHDAAGPGDGSTGIGWHPLIRSAAGFVVRHPVGL